MVIDIFRIPSSKEKVTDEERILKVIGESPKALSFERIHVETSSDRYMPRQRLRQLLQTLKDQGEIGKEIYTLTFSKNPKIESIIAEIYYKNAKQKELYERENLPLLLNDARKVIS